MVNPKKMSISSARTPIISSTLIFRIPISLFAPDYTVTRKLNTNGVIQKTIS